MPTQACIVLAGGLGTRLRSAVGNLPKCLAPVGKRPFIEIQIDALLASGVDDLVLSLGYGAEQVITALAHTLATKPVRCVTEPSLLGTGGAVAHVMDQLGLHEAMVANGDTFLSGDIGAMLRPLDTVCDERFRMALVTVPDCGRFGAVQVAADGRVRAFLGKGVEGSGQINAGLYRLDRRALPVAGTAPYSLESDVLPDLARAGVVFGVPIDGSFTDIGVPEDYFRFCRQHGQ